MHGNRCCEQAVRRRLREQKRRSYGCRLCRGRDDPATGHSHIQGRAAIQEFWAGAAAALGMTAVDLSTQVLEVQDDTAREIGHFTIHGAEGVLDQGKYVVIWKNTDDGWRWHWDI